MYIAPSLEVIVNISGLILMKIGQIADLVSAETLMSLGNMNNVIMNRIAYF